MTALARAELQGACVRLIWRDGFEASFVAAWLLDNAPAARLPSGQRLRTAASLAAAGELIDAAVTPDSIRFIFEHDAVAWSVDALRAHAAPQSDATRSLWPLGKTIADRPSISYAAYIQDDSALRSALAEVDEFGLVRLSGAGADLDELERTVARFGFIRETNYGRLFEVRVAPDPDNLAFTAQALEPHTDNPYRDPAPTLQLLHGIRDAGGGATTFIDGFALAESFREAHPEDFARLATHSVPFAFTSAKGERFEARTPVIRTTPDGAVCGIRFNHRSLAPVPFAATDAAAWYKSYINFAHAADAPERRLAIVLQPGDIVLFDNERILHGREAFLGRFDRLLRGCYADRDALRATLARLDRAA